LPGDTLDRVMTRGLLLAGLLISALLVAWLTLRSSSKRASPSASASAAPSGKLGEVPGAGDMQNGAQAKKYIENQQCASSCEGALQTCLSLADGESAESRCREQRDACTKSCQ
jgi:hypothetical protein